SIYDAIRDSLVHPFSKTEVMLDYKDDVMLDEYFVVKQACRIHESQWVPRLNPAHPRFMHVDLSLSGDSAGMVMGHVSGKVRLDKMKLDGTFSVKEDPFIIMDFMLRINPPPGSQIDLSKIRAFVIYLSKLYPVAKVTFDGYQSADSVQLLRKAGIEAALQSVDKTDLPYVSLRSAHFERRIATYRYMPYIDEVLDLERDAKKRKVEHPARATKGGKGSKDVSDAAAGVAYACANDPRAVAGVPLYDGGEEHAVPRQVVNPEPEEEIQEQTQRRLKQVGDQVVDFKKLRESMEAE
ncbi:hypothetical protein LCGC14_2549210, partial [marine sediment metagenome]